MVNIAKFETLHNNLWDKHGEVEIFSGRSEDNKSASDNSDCVPSEAQTEPCLLDRTLLSLCQSLREVASQRLPRRSTNIRGSETFETFFRAQLAVSAIFLKAI